MPERLITNIETALSQLDIISQPEHLKAYLTALISDFAKKHKKEAFPLIDRFHWLDRFFGARSEQNQINIQIERVLLFETGLMTLDEKGIKSGDMILAVWNTTGVNMEADKIASMVFSLGLVDRDAKPAVFQCVNIAVLEHGSGVPEGTDRCGKLVTNILPHARVVLAKVILEKEVVLDRVVWGSW